MEQREAEVKAIDAARYEHEMEMAQQEAEEERIRRKEAYARWAVSHNIAFACDVDDVLQACRKRQLCMHKCMTAHLSIMSACKEHPQGRSEHIHSLPALPRATLLDTLQGGGAAHQVKRPQRKTEGPLYTQQAQLEAQRPTCRAANSPNRACVTSNSIIAKDMSDCPVHNLQGAGATHQGRRCTARGRAPAACAAGGAGGQKS